MTRPTPMPARGPGGKFLPGRSKPEAARTLVVTAAAPEVSTLAQLIDEMGDLELETQPWRAKIARLEALRSAVRSAYDGSDAVCVARVEGAKWICVIGARGSQSVVDRAELHRRVGPNKFIAAAAVSVKAAEDVCGKDVASSVVSMRQTGPRALTLVPR